MTNEALRAEWESVKRATGKKGKLRSNQNLSYAGIITFGTEAHKTFERLTPDQQDPPCATSRIRWQNGSERS